MQYVKKDNNLLTDLPKESYAAKMSPFQTAIQMAKEGNVQEAMEIIPARDRLIHGAAILKELTTLSPPNANFVPHFTLQELSWDQDLWKAGLTTLILYGPTDTGKTTLALTLLPKALMTTHLDLLTMNTNDGIIFDDMAFKHLHHEAQIALLDCEYDRQIHIRYKVATIKAHTPKIITSNKLPHEIVNVDHPAIARRITLVHVPKKSEFILINA